MCVARPGHGVPQQTAGSSVSAPSVSNNKLARALMLIVEHEGAYKNSSGGPQWTGTISIEHVLPRNIRNPKADWTNLPQPGWNDQLQTAWLHRLGNLAMLNDSDNSSLGNVSFSQKVAKMKELGHSSSWTIKDLLEHHHSSVWNAQAVERRHQRLLTVLRNRWSVDNIKADLASTGLLLIRH